MEHREEAVERLQKRLQVDAARKRDKRLLQSAPLHVKREELPEVDVSESSVDGVGHELRAGIHLEAADGELIARLGHLLARDGPNLVHRLRQRRNEILLVVEPGAPHVEPADADLAPHGRACDEIADLLAYAVAHGGRRLSDCLVGRLDGVPAHPGVIREAVGLLVELLKFAPSRRHPARHRVDLRGHGGRVLGTASNGLLEQAQRSRLVGRHESPLGEFRRERHDARRSSR